MNLSERADLIALAKRKNEAHKQLRDVLSRVRIPGGPGRTEKDRDIAMEAAARVELEQYENLVDEFSIKMAELAAHGRE